MTSRADQYWQQYLTSLPRGEDPPPRYVEAFCFGFTPRDASEIADLVLEGTKTATGSALWSYEADGKSIPRGGDHWIVNDGTGKPACIIRTTDVSIVPFDEVPELYAREGGEADRSLETWRPMYWRHIVSESRRTGREPHESAPLVMERFVVVYREEERRVSFDRQPTLNGTLVELRPLRPEDHAALYVVAADPLIWEQHPARNRHEAAVFRAFFSEALASGGALLVTDAHTQRAIGSSRFHGYSEERSEVEIGWTFLARSHWGGRYNGELKQLMLRHAFRFVRSVVFCVSPENLRSRRAVEKIGGVREPAPDAEGRVAYRITASAFAGRACPSHDASC